MKTVECKAAMKGNILTARLLVGEEITEPTSIEIDVPLKDGGTRAQRIPFSQARTAGLTITGPDEAVRIWDAEAKNDVRADADQARFVRTGRI